MPLIPRASGRAKERIMKKSVRLGNFTVLIRRSFISRFKSLIIPALTFVFAFFLFAAAGFNMGNPELFASFVGGEEIVENRVVNIDGDELLRKAYADGSVTVNISNGSYAGSASNSTDITGAFAKDYSSTISTTVNVSYGNTTKANDLYAGGRVTVKLDGYAHIQGSGSSGGGLRIEGGGASYMCINGSNIYNIPNTQVSGNNHPTWGTTTVYNQVRTSRVTSASITAKGWTIHDTSVFHKTKYGNLSISMTLTITVSDTTKPNISLHSDTKNSDWAQKKKVYFTVTDDGASSGNMVVSSGNGASYTGANNKWQTTSDVTSDLTVTATDHIGNPESVTFPKAQMKIDQTKPAINSVKFYQMTNDSSYDSSEEVSSSYKGKVAMVVTASDEQSGLKSISVTNGRGYSPAAKTSSPAVFYNVPNGKYTVTVTDNVDWSTTGTYYMYYIDTQQPTISVALSKATSSTSYANGPITATFTIVDAGGGGSNYNTTNEKNIAADIGNDYQNARCGGTIVLNDRVKGRATTKTLSSGNGTYNQGVWTYTVAFSLYYSSGGASGKSYTFTVTDTAGNTTSSATYSGNSITEIHTYIDTTAPTISGVEAHPYLSGSSGPVDNTVNVHKTDWTKNDVELKVAINDTAKANGKSDCYKVELFKGTSATDTPFKTVNVSKSDAYAVFTITDDWITTKNYYIRVTDNAGNHSDMSTGSVNPGYDGAAYSDSTYYSNANLTNDFRTCRVNKDSVIPTVNIYSAQNTSSTNFASSSPSKSYVTEWRIDDMTYYVCVTFGPSGGILYESVNGATATAVNTYNHSADIPANNTKWNTRTKSQEGLKTYVYTFTSNTGIDYVCGDFTTKIDKQGPTVTLLGFGTGFTGAPSNNDDAINNASSYIGNFKSQQYLMNNWFYADGLTAYVLVSDGDSGASGESQTWGNNGAQTQNSACYAYVSFSHNGYNADYAKYWTSNSSNYVHPTKYGNVYVLAIQLYRTSGTNFSNTLLRSATKGGNSIVTGSGLDLAYGSNSPLNYKIKISDFVGNERVLGVNYTVSADNTVLSYRVDPFMPNGYVESVVTRSNNSPYDYSIAGRSWTKDGIEITIRKSQMGLSETTVEYGFYNVMDLSNGTTVGYVNDNAVAADYIYYNYLSDGDWTTIPGISADGDSDSGNSATAKVRLSSASSRCCKFFFRIKTKATKKELDTDSSGNNVILRQDVDAPKVKAVFMSTESNIAAIPEPSLANNYYLDNRILLYYEFVESSGTYTVNRRYLHVSDETVWTNTKVYLYIVGSDYNGVGLGSGINRIIININSVSETLTSTNLKNSQTFDPYNHMYVTTKTFGYEDLSKEYGINLQIFDSQDNNQTISKEKDSGNHKLLPVVDGKVPVISINTATYAGKNYMSGSILGGSKIKESLDIAFGYSIGVSGATVYARTREFRSVLDNSDPVKANSSVPGNVPVYHKYTEADIDLSGSGEWTMITAGSTDLTVGDNLTWGYQISNAGLVSIKNRYDFIIVNGAGIYYYFDGGDVFIDTAPPIFESVFYALASDPDNAGENGVIDKSKLQLLSLSDWTNDSIYAYYYVSDAASGVDRVVYNSGTATPLTKVAVKVSDELTTEGGTKGDGYYRLLLNSKQNYQVTAYDEAENAGVSAIIQPCIDKNAIELTVSLEAGGGTYTSGSWTNQDNVVITLGYRGGGSGFAYIEYSCVGYGEEPDLWTTLVSGSGGQTYSYEFIINTEGRATYYFRAYNGVTTTFAKYVGDTQVRPYGVYTTINDGSQSDYGAPVVVAIDRQAPVISADIDASNVSYLVNNWHNEAQSLILGVCDDNGSIDVSGVGVDESNRPLVIISYSVGGVPQANQNMSRSGAEDEWTVYTSGAFKLAYYVNYTITVTDAAGNVATRYLLNGALENAILPKIDATAPTFEKFTYKGREVTYKLQNESPESDYTAGYSYEENGKTINVINWTSSNVVATISVKYSISGATIMYSEDGNDFVRNEGLTRLWDLSFSYNNPPTTGTVEPRSDGLSTITFVPVGTTHSLNHTYRIKLISASGLESAVIDFGRISIDQVTPSLDVHVNNPTGGNIAGSWDGTTFTMSGWVSSNIIINARSYDTLVSGYTVYYNTSQGAPNFIAVDGKSNVGNDTSTIQLKANTKEFTHRLTTAVNNYKYEYYIVSGSGLRSETYTVRDVKIDNTEAVLNLSGVCGTADAAPSAGKFASATLGDYVNKPSYPLNGSEWSKSNSIVLKVNVPSINISGVTVKIKDKATSNAFVTYETKAYNNGRGADFYYVIPYTTDLEVTVVTGAGNSIVKSASIKLDNAIPALFVKSVTGVKSSNWTDYDPLDPTAYDPDSCWYIGNVAINLGLGVFAKENDNWVLKEAQEVGNEMTNVPVSGYSIEYSVDGGDNWIDNGVSTVIPLSGIKQNSYKFRITSASGMSYTVGNGAFDNNNVRRLEANEIKEEVEAVGGITYHLPANPASPTIFVYNINVDTNEYSIIDKQTLRVVRNGQIIELSPVFGTDGNEDPVNFFFATYSYEIKQGDAWVPVDSGQRYHRGDSIKIKYTSNSADNYVHNYTDYGVYKDGDWYTVEKGATNIYPDSTIEGDHEIRKRTYTGHENADGDDLIYQFSDSSLTIDAYFIKDLTVTYGDLVLYKQSQSNAGVTATTTYSYYIKREGSSPTLVSFDVPVSVAYKNLAGTAVDPTNLTLGTYLIEVTVDGDNRDFFRLTNGRTLYVVKYFTEALDNNGDEIPNSVDTPYTIYTAEDLSYVSSSYAYKTSYEAETTYYYQYSECSYRLANDLTINGNNGVADSFSGTFDGQGHTVTMVPVLCENASYGFFYEFGGTAHNMTIKLADTLHVKGTVIGGIFATMMYVNAKAYNVAVEGDIVIDDGGVAGMFIAGFAGIMCTGSQVGGTTTDKSIYVDVAIYNNGVIIHDAYIGGLTAAAEDGAKIFGSYVNAHIVIYNVGVDVYVGALAGSVDTTLYAGDEALDYYFNNRFVTNNVFRNDELVEGFIGVNNNINDAIESKNTVRKLSYADSVDINGVGGIVVAGKSLRNRTLDKIYSDFGLTPVEYVYTDGEGTDLNKLVIDSVAKLRLIDRYPYLSYKLLNDLDLSDFGEALALHEAYTGTFDANGHKLDNLGNGFDISDGNRVGLFAEVKGTVTDLILTDVDFDVETDKATVYAGAVAAKFDGFVNKVIVIGTTKVISTGTVYIGSLTGYSSLSVTDYFSINNVYASGATVCAGGVSGYDDSIQLNTVFSLGRVEAYSDSSLAGAIVGDGNATSSFRTFFIGDNTYVNGVIGGSSIGTEVDLDDVTMRNTTFTGGTNVFNKVFAGDDHLYYLSGAGIGNNKFIIESAEDFAYIDHMLYAAYNVKQDITFTTFKTIGVGLAFTGSIDGKNADSWSAQDGTVSTLKNVTSALVYKNSGRITDLGINVSYTKILASGEDETFGAVAIKNESGTIRNVTVGGTISILATASSTVIASGFVGESNGGSISGDSKVQNSISGLDITISGAGTVYAGGYVGVINGSMTLSYGIGSGNLTITDCGIAYAGTLVGRANRECDWSSIDETADYRYVVTVNGTPTTDLFGYYPS